MIMFSRIYDSVEGGGERKHRLLVEGRSRNKIRNIFCVLCAFSAAFMTALTIIVIIIALKCNIKWVRMFHFWLTFLIALESFQWKYIKMAGFEKHLNHD